MKRYNLSDIMKRAHYIFNHTFNATFSYCLKKAWAEAKEAAKINEENAKRAAEYKSKYGKIVTIETTVPITVHAWDVMIGNVIIVTI